MTHNPKEKRRLKKQAAKEYSHHNHDTFRACTSTCPMNVNYIGGVLKKK